MDDDEIRGTMDPALSDDHFENVKGIHSAPFSRANGIDVVSVKEDEVITKMSLTDDKKNSLGLAHGAVVFAVADDAFAVAANLKEEQIALSCSIVYHKPGVGNELTAVASKLNETNSVSTYSVKVYCDGKHIATATFIGFKTRNRKKN
ncbi:MAG: hotdog fold thioesterase [Methanomassiliicoccaceae archaeon]|nr:hotdog fold thioesterase [Methanomassiliicoccaceae archaeon]